MLSLSRYRFHLVAETPLPLPSFYGQTLRGGLATAMRRAVCVTHQPLCDGCLLRRQCAYGVLFEPISPPSLSEPRFANAPRPYVLGVPFDTYHRGPRCYAPEDVLTFEITLLGNAVCQLPYFVYAIIELGRRGLGREQGRFRLRRVAALHVKDGDVFEQEIFDGESLRGPPPPLTGEDLVHSFVLPDLKHLTVRFLTPTRLDLDGDLVFPITFHALVRGLVNRITTLERFYGSPEDVDPIPMKYAELLDAAREVRMTENAQRWLDLERYSTRQRTKLKMGGAIGSAVYECEDFKPFVPLLALGEWLHMGKLTTMGLGKFEIVR